MFFGLELRESLFIGGGGLLGLALLLVFLRSLFRGGRKKKGKITQVDLREFLADYPEPPATMSMSRLLIDGLEVRLRLVVMVPTGTEKEPLEVDDIPELLDDFRRGLGAFFKSDEPRVLVWPPQLSVSGFAPTFFRLVESPDPEGVKSHWIRIAGPIKIVGKPYLLGLACLAEHPSKLGGINVAANEWKARLTIDK